ncbi:50S ribosomal protein L25/general stress protein Ctc [Sporosarcina sp. BI001-red]|uniref:50S ribosomal protein L25/general stress protein Ctc n=1 Tax=Sporosarcina sp. BI001-red TaxID=2282866 RepID=UPI000E236F59|nr:50S ribosomal protein L25/general stress protein Ctc [Sporosarcina sp. BI001-red]REB11434.1 50S ribosomal protein L25/general stress protein Ctc [Sporosarcina sp. BI001-red]
MSTALQSEKRETAPQSALRQLRQEGKVPSVVYGFKTDSTSITVEERDLIKIIQEHGRNGAFKLDVGGKKVDVMLSDYQADVLTGKVEHADFLSINMSEELEVDVTIHLTGESVGEKAGGVVQQPLWEVKVKAKPSDIPEHINVDVSKLDVGEAIQISDLRAGAKYEILNEDEETVVLISAPRTEEELEALDEETASQTVEPEVVNEKDGDKE